MRLFAPKGSPQTQQAIADAKSEAPYGALSSQSQRAERDTKLVQHASQQVDQLCLDDARALARATVSVGAHEQVLKTFAKAKQGQMSIVEAKQLARSAMTPATNDQILVDYADANAAQLDSRGLRTLARATQCTPAQARLMALAKG